MANNEFKGDYTLENSNVKLNHVSHIYKCEICGQTLCIICNKTILIKAFSSVIDTENNKIVFKCGKCKHFNTNDISKLIKGEENLLLNI